MSREVLHRIYENKAGYDKIDAPEQLDKDINCKFKEYIETLPFDPTHFSYPNTVTEKYLYAEDVEEAIIQYLVKAGMDEEELRLSHFYFDENGKWTTIQCLKIKWI